MSITISSTAPPLVSTPPNKPALSLAEAQEQVALKTAPKVTVESIEAEIADVQYIPHGLLTLCIITMKNGFKFVGKASPTSAANYDYEVGQRYAYDDAFKPIWSHEGYLLREQLHSIATNAASPPTPLSAAPTPNAASPALCTCGPDPSPSPSPSPSPTPTPQGPPPQDPRT